MRKNLIALVLLAAVAPAIAEQTPEQMRREIEADYQRMKQADLQKKERQDKAAQEAREREAEAQKRSKKDMTPCGTEAAAYVMSQEAVKRRLKAPATADFPYLATASNFIGNCQWFIMGDVDSQNSFGAMLRTSYSITMEYHPKSGTWSGFDLYIEKTR